MLAFLRRLATRGFTILSGLQGLATVISGGIVFLRFMRQPVEMTIEMSAKIQRLAEVGRMIHQPARLLVVAVVEEAGYIAIEKTFRGKYPLTICRLTQQGRGVFDNYRKVIKAAL